MAGEKDNYEVRVIWSSLVEGQRVPSLMCIIEIETWLDLVLPFTLSPKARE